MKKTFLILIVILVILITATLFFQKKETTTPIQNYQPTVFPASSSTVSVDYSKIIENTNTIEVSPGMYNLNEKLSNPDIGFAILYTESDNSIYLSIDKKPLAQTREQASKYLLDLLSVSPEAACTLKVYVGVPYDIDAELSGKNLGLSFCPGSIPL